MYVIAITLAISFWLLDLGASRMGIDALWPRVFRVILTIVLCVLLWMGSNKARWILIVLQGGVALWSWLGPTGSGTGGGWALLLGTAYGVNALLLAFSKSVRAFMAHQVGETNGEPEPALPLHELGPSPRTGGLGRLIGIYEEFGLYQAVRLVFGLLLMLGLPAMLIVFHSTLYATLYVVEIVVVYACYRLSDVTIENAETTKIVINMSMVLSTIMFMAISIQPDLAEILLSAVSLSVTLLTSLLYWTLSHEIAVDLDVRDEAEFTVERIRGVDAEADWSAPCAAGYALAHFAWSLADRDAGDQLCPVAIVASAGDRLLCRFEPGTGDEADLMGRFMAHRLSASAGAVAVARKSVSRGEAGTVDVIVVQAWGTGLAEPITVVQEFQAPESASGFRLLGEPMIVQGRQVQEPAVVRPLLDEVYAGIRQHPEARGQWSR